MLPDGERFVYTLRETDSMRVARLDGTTIATLPFSARDVHLAPPRWLALANEQDARALDIQEMDWQSLAPRGPRTRLVGDLRNAGGDPVQAAQLADHRDGAIGGVLKLAPCR